MNAKTSKSLLSRANHAFQMRDFSKALKLYKQLEPDAGPLKDSLSFSIELCLNELNMDASSNNSEQQVPEMTAGIKNISVETKSIQPPVVHYQLLTSDAGGLKKSSCHPAVVLVIDTYSEHLLSRINELLKFTNATLYVISSDPRFSSTQNRSQNFIVLSPTAGNATSEFIRHLNHDTFSNHDYMCLITKFADEHMKSPEDYDDFLNLQVEVLLKATSTVLSCFEMHPTIGRIGAAEGFKNSNAIATSTRLAINNLLAMSNNSHLTFNSIGYFSSGCHWSRTCIIRDSLNALIPEASSQDVNTTREFTELLYTAAHRLAGLETGLLYSRNLENTGFSVVLASTTKIPHGSCYTSTASIGAYKNLPSDAVTIKPFFSPAFYLKYYPYIAQLNMPLDYHFLRYGAHEGFNLNKDTSSAWNAASQVFALEDHSAYNPVIAILHDSEARQACLPAQENTVAIISIINNSSLFDPEYYLASNPDVARSKHPPLSHYIKYGWTEGRAPCRASVFDALWYESQYLSDHPTPINPLLHYITIGKYNGFLPRPRLQRFRPSSRFKKGQSIKRVCLFASYDTHGVVDDYVVQLVEELNKHSDVYFLADSSMRKEELEKLRDITIKAWAFRHGEYDFGSYSRLATQLVGWQVLQEYDEVLLVNDSGYLLKGLDDVFSKMSAKKCDWWGLQATKGIAATRHINSNQFKKKIPMPYVLETLTKEFEKDDCYDFLIGSYFLAFRKPTLGFDGALHRILSNVRKERNKKNVVLKYEVGITRQLIADGHRPATFIDDLYPFHPIFTENHFELIKEGFPLLKRYYLTENHYRSPGLKDWKSRVQSILPEACLDIAERNLNRVSNAEKLYTTLNIPYDDQEWPPRLMLDEEFIREDIVTPKDKFLWAFPVCGFDHSFGGNERMVFEHVKNDPNIKKVILYRTKIVQASGINVVHVPLKSREGQLYLLQATYIFIKHTPWRNTIYPLNPDLHRFINLWHGIPLKRIGFTSLDMADKLDASAKEHDKCHCVIASSKIDRLAMASAFYPLSYHDVWVTGLPRNDVILRDEISLPADFQAQLQRLRVGLRGRRLVMYAPTFRNGQESSLYDFSESDIEALVLCLRDNNAVLGIREHMAAKHDSYLARLADTNVPLIDLGRQHFSDIELIYREADVLITDYSSCFIDFMLTGKPEICFAYDYTAYATSERGLFYELQDVFPGPICSTAEDVVMSLRKYFDGQILEPRDQYVVKQKFFFDYIDDNNTERVLKIIFDEIDKNLPSRKRALNHFIEGN
ncbi:CDP-glycerol glycerophosphotransferase family protein [Pseudomonas putida]|uniref:CDP-glycerol glycerophosphotransferase family protein n=1 Tax=Pseudomonas putida TaxID=303 RepID=UPI0018E6B7CA|nr:CDP-glycerol glycerophosphotransferase family protein [Pseudomonas putida]MBI6925131.1 CDP-glycerol glycerophosphotransferase family protein [Pseudomonas putida]